MNVSLSFGHYHHYDLNENRMSLMLQNDEKSAIHISLWEAFKDLFRKDKKSDAYKELYHLLHATDGGDKLDAFNKLKSFSHSEHQSLFTKEIYCDEIVFFIGNEKLGQSSLQSLIGLPEQTPLCSMSVPEQRLFLAMMDTLREKNNLFSDIPHSEIRKLMSDEHCTELLNLYRPQEDIYTQGTEWKKPESLDYTESNLFRKLNRGSMKALSHFSFMGYQKVASGVEFSMLHPSINYLLSFYNQSDSASSSDRDINSGYFKGLNKTYQDYHSDKTRIDSALKKVYHAHGGTLNISYHGINNNKFISAPDVAVEHKFQSEVFSRDTALSLESVFKKWTATS